MALVRFGKQAIDIAEILMINDGPDGDVLIVMRTEPTMRLRGEDAETVRRYVASLPGPDDLKASREPFHDYR